jgi:ferritin-like metal-binding protein YciE
MPNDIRNQLEKYLSDAYSIEQQALAQLRTAPDLVGEPTLASYFREHLKETERQAEMVRERLEAHGGSPSMLKDAVMKLGGKGFLLFARMQPDTPGKLTAHAHSYEALELASYELLLRVAERAGDPQTVAVASSIRDQERAMRDRLASGFDAAVDASLDAKAREDMKGTIEAYLADAHAIEAQALQLLAKSKDIGGDPELDRMYAEHLEETRGHSRQVEERLEALHSSPSKLKDLAMRAGALNWGLFFQAQSDTPGKLAAFAYAFEHLEIASYELLRRTAERAGDGATMRLCDRILPEERAMAERIAGAFDRAVTASLAAEGVTVSARSPIRASGRGDL